MSEAAPSIDVYAVDGTYELFRAFFGAPPAEVNGKPVGAVRAMVRSLVSWMRSSEVTHVGIAFDTVIESFRNDLFAGYKTGDGIDPELWAQFPLAERAAAALGLKVWSMIDFEADDALATMAAIASADPSVRRVYLTSPDKDLAQCVQDPSVVSFDRHRNTVLDEAGVKAKFGVAPVSIPDYLGLVGDDADGIPGLAGFGAKSAATVLAKWGSIDRIPDSASDWGVAVRGADKLAKTLASSRSDAQLYKTLATLRQDCPLATTVADLRYKGPSAEFAAICEELGLDPSTIRLPSF